MSVSWLPTRNGKKDDTRRHQGRKARTSPAPTYCTVCGYDIVQQAKTDLAMTRPVVF